MSTLFLVYEDEGFGPSEPTLHATERDALLEALYRMGDDMDEACGLDDAALQDRLDWLSGKVTDFQACVACGTRAELERMFAETNMEIPFEITPSLEPPAAAPGP